MDADEKDRSVTNEQCSLIFIQIDGQDDKWISTTRECNCEWVGSEKRPRVTIRPWEEGLSCKSLAEFDYEHTLSLFKNQRIEKKRCPFSAVSEWEYPVKKICEKRATASHDDQKIDAE